LVSWGLRQTAGRQLVPSKLIKMGHILVSESSKVLPPLPLVIGAFDVLSNNALLANDLGERGPRRLFSFMK
jgi:hypothetical protein